MELGTLQQDTQHIYSEEKAYSVFEVFAMKIMELVFKHQLTSFLSSPRKFEGIRNIKVGQIHMTHVDDIAVLLCDIMLPALNDSNS